jgi:YggT family protein
MGTVYGIIHWVIQIILWIIQVFILLIVVQAILSYFMDPYHRVRRTIDNIVNPFLNPIRRLIPQTGNLDFSPMVLIILLWILERVLQRLLFSLG